MTNTQQPSPPLGQHMRPVIWVMAALAAVTVASAVAAVALVVFAGDSQPGAEDPAAGAKRACTEEFVPAKLKAPATAKFSDVEIASVDTSSVGETYTVTGSVDSQNGFGALIRSEFTCITHLDGGRWELNSAAVG